MRRFISAILFIVLALPTLLSHSPTTAQTSEEQLLPRFSAHWAPLLRLTDDYNFETALTPNNNYVVGMSYDKDATFYRWDVSGLADGDTQPESQSLDLNQYASQNVGTRHLMFSVVDDELAIARVDSYLLQISISELTVLQTLDLGVSDGNWGSLLVHENLVLTIDDGLHQAVIWNIDTNEHMVHAIDNHVVDAGHWAHGWYLTGYRGTSPVFCDDLLTQCTSAKIQGSISLIMDDIIVIGDHEIYQKEPLYPTRYYMLEDLSIGLVEIESPFPFLPDDHVPVSISPDGKYISVLTPQPTAESSGFAPLRTWMLWDIVEQKPLYRIWGLDNYWFGDHFFASELNLYSAEGPMRLDELDKGFLWNYNFHHEVDGIEQISEDGTRLLYNTGGAAVIFALEYQAVDDLLHVAETRWQLPRGELTDIQLSSTGEYILALEDNLLKRWQIMDESEPVTLDIAQYILPEDGETGFELLVRENDVFLQVGYSLLHIDLATFAILEVIEANSPIRYQNPFNAMLPASGRLMVNQGYVGALYEEDFIVWREDGSLFRTDIHGRTLIPRTNGWLVYYMNFGNEPNLADFYLCDFELTTCSDYDMENKPLVLFYDDNQFVTGNRFIEMYGDAFTVDYWSIDETTQSVKPAEPWLIFPAEQDITYTPIGFYEDYAIVLTPNPYPAYEGPPRHQQIWSMTTGARVTHRTFSGDWVGFEDYLIFSDSISLTIYHLPDGRFTRWQATDLIRDIQINANGDLLLIITSDMLEVVALAQE